MITIILCMNCCKVLRKKKLRNRCGADLFPSIGPRLSEWNQVTSAAAKFHRTIYLITGEWLNRYFWNFGEFSQLSEVNSLKFSKTFVQPISCEKINSPMKFGSSWWALVPFCLTQSNSEIQIVRLSNAIYFEISVRILYFQLHTNQNLCGKLKGIVSRNKA